MKVKVFVYLEYSVILLILRYVSCLRTEFYVPTYLGKCDDFILYTISLRSHPMLQPATVLIEPPSNFQVPETAKQAIIETAVQFEASQISQENVVSFSPDSSRSNLVRKASRVVCFAVQIGESIKC